MKIEKEVGMNRRLFMRQTGFLASLFLALRSDRYFGATEGTVLSGEMSDRTIIGRDVIVRGHTALRRFHIERCKITIEEGSTLTLVEDCLVARNFVYHASGGKLQAEDTDDGLHVQAMTD